ncbi:MAG: hypothetical protein RIT81_45925 [Deltaproteobacteria bacterium]
MRVHFGLGTLAILAACGGTEMPFDDDGPDVLPLSNCDDRTDTPDVETTQMGHFRDDGFHALEDEERIPVEWGLQGGTHVEMDVSFYAEDGRAWRHHFVLEREDGTFLGDGIIHAANCVPGWTANKRNFILVRTSTSGPAILRLSTELWEDDTMVRALSAERSIVLYEE